MASKRITHGDIVRLLEAEGFSPKTEKGTRVRFENAAAGASLILRTQKSATPALSTQLQLVRRTLVDFGFMNEADFERWVANPKHFQAA